MFTSHSLILTNLIGPPGLLVHLITCKLLGKDLSMFEYSVDSKLLQQVTTSTDAETKRLKEDRQRLLKEQIATEVEKKKLENELIEKVCALQAAIELQSKQTARLDACLKAQEETKMELENVYLKFDGETSRLKKQVSLLKENDAGVIKSVAITTDALVGLGSASVENVTEVGEVLPKSTISLVQTKEVIETLKADEPKEMMLFESTSPTSVTSSTDTEPSPTSARMIAALFITLASFAGFGFGLNKLSHKSETSSPRIVNTDVKEGQRQADLLKQQAEQKRQSDLAEQQRQADLLKQQADTVIDVKKGKDLTERLQQKLTAATDSNNIPYKGSRIGKNVLYENSKKFGRKTEN